MPKANAWLKIGLKNVEPRDLAIDKHGNGYLRKCDGSLIPYGRIHANPFSASKQTPFTKTPATVGGNNDSTAPMITDLSPTENEVIGPS